jgi:hypothetical protein
MKLTRSTYRILREESLEFLNTKTSGVPRGGGLEGSNPPPKFRNFDKVPKIKKILLYEMNCCTKLQLPPEPLTRGPLPPDPRSLCPQLNLLKPPPRIKFLGTPLTKTGGSYSYHCVLKS